ncbi:cx9C motif-containing protein 4-like [Sycon ciliatum]|uniref:cx9C motif-containing protein 4-like n=1 Tax=Sycon ciliatum TaxID=27933 RepID=UPI0020A88F16
MAEAKKTTPSGKEKKNVICRPQACAIQRCLADKAYDQSQCQPEIMDLVTCCTSTAAADCIQCSGYKSLIDAHKKTRAAESKELRFIEEDAR